MNNKMYRVKGFMPDGDLHLATISSKKVSREYPASNPSEARERALEDGMSEVYDTELIPERVTLSRTVRPIIVERGERRGEENDR